MKRYKKPTPRHPVFLREWREAAGLTLEQIKAVMGLSISSLSKIENLQTPWYQDVVEMYAEIIGCEPGALLLGPPDPATAKLLQLWAGMSEAQRLIAVRNVEIGDILGKPDDKTTELLRRWGGLTDEERDRALAHVELVRPKPQAPPVAAPKRRRLPRKRDQAKQLIVALTACIAATPICHLILTGQCHGIIPA